MLFKCFKLFPIMLMGRLLGTKSYPLYDYAVAAAIGVGIAVFSVSTEDMEIGQDAIGEVEAVGGTVCGIVLLLFFLVFDSFTGQYQARLFNEHPDLSPYRMMFLVNTFSTVFSFITLVHGKELQPACADAASRLFDDARPSRAADPTPPRRRRDRGPAAAEPPPRPRTRRRGPAASADASRVR